VAGSRLAKRWSPLRRSIEDVSLSMAQVKSLGQRYLLFAFLPALALTAFLLSANWPTYRRLASRGTPTRGLTTSTECETGGRFTFTFEAEGQQWSGHGHARNVGLDCAQLTPGREVPVYFLPGDPARHAATNDPHQLARVELIIVGAFGLVALLACAFFVRARARRRS
jgi:hypothetical protein